MVKIQKVSEVCEIIMGQSPPSDSYNDKGIGMPFFQGKSEFGELNPTPKWYCSSPIRLAEVDDILISVRAPVGDVNIANVNCCIGRGLAAIRPDKTKLLTKFLFYVLKGKKREIENMGTGSTFKAISKKDLVNIKIPVPNIEIQKKIVNTFDKAQELIDKRNAQIEALDQLTQSVFLEMFGDIATNSKGWEYKKLSDICKNLDSKRVPITSSERKKGIYPYYGASGIVDYVNDYIFDGNYLLVSEDGANLLARVTPIAFEVEGKIWVNNHAHVLKFDNLSTQCFIKYVINLQDISHLITGSAQPKLNQKNLNSFMVPVPPLKLQNEFYEKVKLIEEKRKIFHSSLLELERLFNALLQKVFKGGLIFEEKVLNL